MIFQHNQLTFGQFKTATTLLLSGAEQFCNQIGISETPQHDLRVKYVPLVTGDESVMLELRIYLSDDGTATEDASSTWYPYGDDLNDGMGNFDPVIRVYRNPALVDSVAKRNPSRSFPIGAKKIRFGFTEVGSPAQSGSITEAHLFSRS